MSAEEDRTPIQSHERASEPSLGIHIALVLVVMATFSTFAWEVYQGELGRLHSSGWLLREDDPVDFWISTGMWTAIFLPVCWQAFKSSHVILRIAYGKFRGPQDAQRDEVKKQ